ncbi:MAG TPA: Pr6Pr family membrane protein [Chitinophagaceae bacterium]|nr:Pr6Pr family membrane protein [Chitinophagaceae bacterium]
MHHRGLPLYRVCYSVIAVAAWFAVGLQAYITVSSLRTLMFFLSFFTVLSNILVALTYSTLLLLPASKAGTYFGRANVQAAITLYIVVVGLVYNIILRQLWHPEGLQLLADNLLHVIVPAMVLLFWILLAPKHGLTWANIGGWLIYPLMYLIYILIRGAATAQYPYPFIDVITLGYPAMLLNAGGILLLFLFLGCVFTGVAKLLQKTAGKLYVLFI